MKPSSEMTDEEFYGLCNKTIQIAFPNGESDLHKTLWRMTNGNREYSFNLIRGTCLRYGFDIDSDVFDEVCGELSDGLEVEWNEYTCDLTTRTYITMIENNERMATAIQNKEVTEIPK